MTTFAVVRRAFAIVVAAVIARTPLPAQSSEPQHGLRMDSRSSLQWRANRIFVESDSYSVTQTSVDSIYDIWPGPGRGLFAATTSRGLGLLIGRDVIPTGEVLERGAILRSSRPEALWACVSDPESRLRHSRILELRSARHARVLVRSAVPIRDFDVDVAGRIAYLRVDGRVWLAAGGDGSGRELAKAGIDSVLAGRTPRRVYLDASGHELAIYADGVLARLDLVNRRWSTVPFNTNTQALVRHALSRRIRIEPRLSPP